MKRKIPALFLLPSATVLFAIAAFPVAYGVWAGFHQWDWSIGQADKWFFIGFDNYLRLLGDDAFWNSIRVTLYFSVVAVVLELVVGLGIALLLGNNVRGSWFFRSAVVFPLMISDIVAALIFSTLLDPSLGTVNYFLGLLHLPQPNWVGNPHLVILTLALVDTWWQTGNIVLILLAGLTSIPQDRIDMASIDGASGWKMLRHIILPALKPFILVALVFRTIDALRVFALAWAITKGGPSRASEVSQLYIFNLGIGQYFNLGYASAAATLFALFVGLISGGYLLMMRRVDR
ncbi:MAG: multiple sugar transport system permease protein [Rhodospirillaceae bacterium]|jgi:multiple sugar transport system permease protein|nr:multiple sugar transport system permease protein [Rhodospirillaceae bacterium]